MSEVVIITGASRGIGREIAKRLSMKGLTVIANYNKSGKEAEELKKELEEKGFIIDIVKADVSKREDAKKLVKFALDKYGRIDILINNAGISEYKLFTDETDEDWNKVINTKSRDSIDLLKTPFFSEMSTSPFSGYEYLALYSSYNWLDI